MRTVAYKVFSDNIYLKVVLVQKAVRNYQKPGSYTTRYNFKNEPTNVNLIKIWKKEGATLKLFSEAPLTYATSMPHSNANIYCIKCYTPDTLTFTGFKFGLTIACLFTEDQYNGIGLYSVNETTATFLMATANNAAIWKAPTGVVTAPLTSAVTIPPGTYIITLLYHTSYQTTAPSIGGGGTGKLLGISAGLGLWFTAWKSAQTAFPSPTYNLASGLNDHPYVFGVVGY